MFPHLRPASFLPSENRGQCRSVLSLRDGFAGPSIILLLGFYPIPGLLREPAEMSGGAVRCFQGL
ncbi:hypothetical protein PANN_15121 [Pseudomonas aeruginosa C-NN2]|nr:hypothetical protein PANN_15121 [Pseudomonas aeruginosa C-NN2]